MHHIAMLLMVDNNTNLMLSCLVPIASFSGACGVRQSTSRANSLRPYEWSRLKQLKASSVAVRPGELLPREFLMDLLKYDTCRYLRALETPKEDRLRAKTTSHLVFALFRFVLQRIHSSSVPYHPARAHATNLIKTCFRAKQGQGQPEKILSL